MHADLYGLFGLSNLADGNGSLTESILESLVDILCDTNKERGVSTMIDPNCPH